MNPSRVPADRAFTILESLVVLVVLAIFSMIALALYWHHVKTPDGGGSASAAEIRTATATLVSRA